MDSSTFAARLCVNRWFADMARRSWAQGFAVALLGGLLGMMARPPQPAAAQSAPGEDATVGIVLGDSSQAHRRAANAIRRELRSLMRPERRVQFPEAYRRVLDTGGNADLKRLLSGETGPSVVIAVGLSASHRLATTSRPDVPVVAAHVLDPSLQGLPRAGDASGAANLTYVTEPDLVRENMALLRSLTPASAPISTCCSHSYRELSSRATARMATSQSWGDSLQSSHSVELYNMYDRRIDGLFAIVVKMWHSASASSSNSDWYASGRSDWLTEGTRAILM